MSTIKFNEEDKIQSPMKFLAESWNHSALAVCNLGKFCYYGTKWLFTHYPNQTWFVITTSVIITSFVYCFRVKAEMDKMSHDEVVMMDSLSKANMDRVIYTNMSGKQVSPISPEPYKDSVK